VSVKRLVSVIIILIELVISILWWWCSDSRGYV